jgi:ABC-type multidrug transport system ATPase subunit
VQEVCSRVLVIHRGRLRADGPPGQLVARDASRALRVAVRGTTEQLTAVLDSLPGVTSRVVQLREDRIAAASLQLAANVDPTTELGLRLLAAGLPVVELHTELPTLEEFFHEITEGSDLAEEEAAVAAAAAGETR